MEKNLPLYNPFPAVIEIQTTSACNAGCIICPHRVVHDSIPKGIMSMEIFKDIIDQIENPWLVRIIPYFNNEPFLDPLIFDRLEYINDRCPSAEIEISTNASCLDAAIQEKLTSYSIKELRLSIFGFTEESYVRMMPGLDWATTLQNVRSLVTNKKLRASIGQVSLVMIDYPGISQVDITLARDFCKMNFIKFEFWGFLDRSGNVSDYSNEVKNNVVRGCEQRRLIERMHINVCGDVVLCCMDWRQEHILGKVTEQRLKEIWNSDLYVEYRRAMYQGGPDRYMSLCRKCKLAI